MLVTLLGFALLGGKVLESLIGDVTGLVIVLMVLVIWLYFKFVCQLLPLDGDVIPQRAGLKISWLLGGGITPLKSVLACVIVIAAAIIHGHFYEHLPFVKILPSTLAFCAVMAWFTWRQFR